MLIVGIGILCGAGSLSYVSVTDEGQGSTLRVIGRVCLWQQLANV